jgi:FtsP/CotA-like multicopper oxidase with cupredoxin domain
MAGHRFGRRRLLSLAAHAGAGAALAALLPGCARDPRAGGPVTARAAPRTVRLRAAEGTQSLAGAGHPHTAVWTYNGRVPGPELRYRQGDRLVVEVENALAVDTTVHFHGIRLPNAMDGVPELTQAPIARRGGRFTYEFDLPDAGTYWYHPHLASSEQVGRGLYGALVIEEAHPPEVDRDVVWVLSDWRLDRSGAIVGGFDNPRDASHAGRVGNTVTVNGEVRERFAVRPGERLRLRLVNACSARIFNLELEGLAAQVIALDGHPTTPHRPPEDRLLLGPAQRADLIVDLGEAAGVRHRVIDHSFSDPPYRVIDLVSDGALLSTRKRTPIASLAPNPVGVPDLASAIRHRIEFGGGAMGELPDQRAHRGMFWTLNGRVVDAGHHRHEVLFAARRGSSCVLELVNNTAWHHPIHLHGLVFRVLTRNGQPPPFPYWSDTLLLDPDERAEIGFVADNPGDWMLHCHILEHQATGMMALIRVA